MDYIEGETLEIRLDKAGNLPIEELLNIGIQLSTVLGYVHTRQPPIIFRDLKPANVMLTADEHLYLIDFGIARLFKPGKVKDTLILGSPGYAAPEQYGKAQTTASADIYSLGVMLHQLISGSDPSLNPFQFSPLQLGNQPGLALLESLIMQMVETSKDKRPSNMANVKQELQRIATKQTVRPTLTISSTPTTSQKTKEQWLEEGNILMNLTRYQEALTAFEQVIRLDPNLADAYNDKSYVLIILIRYHEGLDACEQAIRLNPNLAMVYNNKGWALNNLGRYQEALIACEQAISLDPNVAMSYSNKGGALNNLGRYQEALIACEQAIRLDPNIAMAYNHKGWALNSLGRYQKALIACEQAISLDPKLANAYINLNYALNSLGRYR